MQDLSEMPGSRCRRTTRRRSGIASARLSPFTPVCIPTSSPGIIEPHPSVTWALPPRDVVVASEPNVHAKMLAAFREMTPADGFLYALDWQHRCYRFRPHADFDVW